MKSKLRSLFIMLLAMFLFSGTHCQAAEFVLIVNTNNPIDSLSRRSTELIFLGKKTRWLSGFPVHVAVNNEKDTYDAFCREILNKTPGQYLIYRKKMLFTGSGIPPQVMESDDEMINFVSGSRLAIGFIKTESLDSRVKKLTIFE
ncbi:MAG: hypothetical protein V1706_06700 [Pseudomonadota bacterium]